MRRPLGSVFKAFHDDFGPGTRLVTVGFRGAEAPRFEVQMPACVGSRWDKPLPAQAGICLLKPGLQMPGNAT